MKDRPHPRWPLWLLLALAVAFENVWMWGDSRLVFGVPVNLAYHLGLCLAASAGMAVVVLRAWPDAADR